MNDRQEAEARWSMVTKEEEEEEEGRETTDCAGSGLLLKMLRIPAGDVDGGVDGGVDGVQRSSSVLVRGT